MIAMISAACFAAFRFWLEGLAEMGSMGIR